MSLKLSLLLLFALVALTVTKRPVSSPNKFSHAFEKVMSPYQNVFDATVNNANTHFESLKSVLQGQLAAQNSANAAPLHLYTNQAASTDDQTSNDESGDDHDRILANNPCQHGSILTKTQVNIFMCNNLTVTEDQYIAQGGAGCNAQYNVSRLMCYCSYEFYGDLCENFNPWTCQLNRLNYPETCQGTDSFDYVYSKDGIPPCYSVSNGENITIDTKMECTPSNSQYNFEGVKPKRYQVVEQPTVAPNLFTYLIEGNNVKLTFEPSQFNQQISFTNWNLMSEPYQLNTTLTSAQILGNDTIKTDVSFVAPLTNFAMFGRYYYEIIIDVGAIEGVNTILTNNYYYGGYFEQAGYKEPAAPSTINTGLAVGLSIMGALLLIAVFLIVRRIRNKKRLASYRERANSLFVDDRQD